MELSHQQVGFMMMIQTQICGYWIKFIASISLLCMSLCTYFIAKTNPELAGNAELFFVDLQT